MSKEKDKQDPKEKPKEIWTEKVLKDLQEAIKHDIPISEFKELYPDIPDKELKEKVKFYTGVSNARGGVEFIAGMGRLSTDDLPANAERFQFPKVTFRKPYVVSTE